MNDWPAPAKINLFLHVVGRRNDGYHHLQTVFRFLDVGDSLHFMPRNDGAINLLTPLPNVPVASDLTVRAALLLQRVSGTRLGADIALDKQLPLGGGLGGGSSDAATTLIALNHLWQTGLTSLELQKLGLQLGADVPIFIYGHTAFAEGVGERFTDVAPPPAWYLVLVPPVAVPTAEIFNAPDLRRDTPAICAEDWHADFGANDLEAVACKLYPQVAAHLNLLRAYTRPRMSGSGSCVFAEFSSELAAREAQAALPKNVQGFVAQGIDRHPLRKWT